LPRKKYIFLKITILLSCWWWWW